MCQQKMKQSVKSHALTMTKQPDYTTMYFCHVHVLVCVNGVQLLVIRQGSEIATDIGAIMRCIDDYVYKWKDIGAEL